MNEYDIPYEFYPFDMSNLNAKFETVEAENLEDAFEIVKEKYGDIHNIFIDNNNIVVFKRVIIKQKKNNQK